jgi:hypothetical protein
MNIVLVGDRSTLLREKVCKWGDYEVRVPGDLREEFVDSLTGVDFAIALVEYEQQDVVWKLGYMYCSGIPVILFTPGVVIFDDDEAIAYSSVLLRVYTLEDLRTAVHRLADLASRPGTLAYVAGVLALRQELRSTGGPVI